MTMEQEFSIWEAAAAGGSPSDQRAAWTQSRRLNGTLSRSRAAFAQLGRLLESELGVEVDAATGTPVSYWGTDASKPCLAVWPLVVDASRAEAVAAWLARRAPPLGLVVLDHQRERVYAPELRFTSTIRVEEDRIVGVLYAQPARSNAVEKAVADAIAPELSRHGFVRRSSAIFERSFPAGRILLAIEAIEAGALWDVGVDVGVVFEEARKILSGVEGLQPHFLPGAPSMVSPLQVLASATESTRRLFTSRPPGRYALPSTDLSDASRLAEKQVAPMLAAITHEKWFEDPKTAIGLYLDLYLQQGEALAGFEFVCMEDLILANIYQPKRLGPLFRKRVQAERDFSASVPAPSRWSTVEGLQKLYAHLAKPNPKAIRTETLVTAPGLAGEIERSERANSARGLLKRLVLPALVLKMMAWLAANAATAGGTAILALSTSFNLAALVLTAVALYAATPPATGRHWLRWILPWATFIPYASAIVLIYVSLRLAAQTRKNSIA